MNMFSSALIELQNTFGMEACIAAAEEIYSALYKSEESFTFEEFLKVNDNAPHLRYEFKYLVAESLAIASGEYIPLTPEEREYEVYIDDTPIYNMFPIAEKLLDSGIRFVELCNYKGESEGYMLEELSHSLKTYISKYNYR